MHCCFRRGCTMNRRGITSGVVASTLIVAAVSVPSAGPAVAATPEYLPTTSLVAPPPSAKKRAKGVLRVKVTGTGSYTLRSKGFRKAGTSTKTYRLRPGLYKVKAPGATVHPKKKLRVRKGKKTTVRVAIPRKTPAPVPPTEPGPTPTPTPVQPPSSGPVSQWVLEGTEATVSTGGGYALHIPAGVLQQSATVSVTPLDAAPGGLPGADFQIDGAWSGAVQVTLPTDASGDPLVLHEASDGLRITSGNAAQRGTFGGVTAVTASVTSLSSFYSAAISCDAVSEVARSFLCADQTDQRLADLLTAAGTEAGAGVQTDRVNAAALSSDCPNSSPVMVSSGDLAKGITCSESLSGSLGEWKFTNTTHASYLGGLYAAGAVYTMNVSGTFDRTVDRPHDILPILWPLWLAHTLEESICLTRPDTEDTVGRERRSWVPRSDPHPER